MLVQENASRPDGLPPNQGGKYVGFGSSPAPSSKPQRGGPGGLDDYQQYLSKGISQLSTVAGKLHVVCLQVRGFKYLRFSLLLALSMYL